MRWKEYDYKTQWSDKFGVTYRPMLQVKLSNGDESFWPLSLVDSGSDATLINSEIAEAIGVNLAPCKRLLVGGVGNTQGRLCEITLEIPDLEVKKEIEAIFIDDLPFNVLLGQRDFFSSLDVRFEGSRHKFYLKPPQA